MLQRKPFLHELYRTLNVSSKLCQVSSITRERVWQQSCAQPLRVLARRLSKTDLIEGNRVLEFFFFFFLNRAKFLSWQEVGTCKPKIHFTLDSRVLFCKTISSFFFFYLCDESFVTWPSTWVRKCRLGIKKSCALIVTSRGLGNFHAAKVWFSALKMELNPRV